MYFSIGKFNINSTTVRDILRNHNRVGWNVLTEIDYQETNIGYKSLFIS